MKRCRIFFPLIFIFMAGCSQDRVFKETRVVMDTFGEISCYETDEAMAVQAMDAAFKEMQRIEKLFSKFDENSEVSRINKLAGREEVIVTKEVLMLIQDSIYYSSISEGAFDITIGPLMELWGFVRKKNSMPDSSSIEETLRDVGYKNIIINSEKQTITFLHEGIKIDFGGIAKGYAVDRAKDILLSHGIKNGMVNLGGNIFAFGERDWRIGIQDPVNKGKLIGTLKLKNQAISTSGNYERFFESGGKRYSHIINPVTGWPSQGIISVTVVSNTAKEADALSTAIFVMGEEKGIELGKSIKLIQVLILREDGKIISYP